VTSRDDLLQLLADSAVFADAGPAARAQLLRRAQVCTFAAGDVVLREGDAPDSCVVITSGLLEVTMGDPPARLRFIGRGAVVGELGVLTEQPRSATVRALRPTDALMIPASDFNDALTADPVFQGAVLRRLARQVVESRPTQPDAPPPRRRVALVDGTSGRAASVVAGLVDDMQAVARVATVPADAGTTDLVAALQAADNHDRVVMVLGDPNGPNAEQCIRLADRVVVVTDPGTTAPPAGTGSWAGCEVVAVGSDPLGAKVAARYVLPDPGATGRRARVARRLAGRAIGVVLSSGGARAFAHVGVLMELEAAGVVIDRVGACSLGSVAGVLYAGGHSPDDVRRIITEVQPLETYLEHGSRTIEKIAPVLAGYCAEPERDFFCVSIDLASGTRRVHREDPLGEALEATMALPGLINPAVRGHTVYVDGALSDPLPVDVMYAEGDGPIVAVDVSGRPERMAYWSAQWAEPDADPPPLADVAVQAMDVASVDRRARARALADLVIDPTTPFGTLAFDKLPELIEVGREAGRQTLAGIDPTTRATLRI
jgi:NTE family protein